MKIKDTFNIITLVTIYGSTRVICEKYYIEAMFDDRNQVVNHARKLGFSVFQVNEGGF